MRLLVSGGAGFIGSHVVQQALAAGFEVAVLDNFSTGKRHNVPEGVRIFECDLRDREATFAAVRDYQPDLVSHQAAQASVSVSVRDPRLDLDINVMGGLNLLDACTATGAKVERFVFASTGGAIYGEVPEGELAREDRGFVPKSPYAISKLAFEQLLGIYREHRGLPVSVLRYANVYGPRQDPHGEAGVIAIFFDSALAGRKLLVFAKKTLGDGGCLRDYVFVSDVARANMLALSGKLQHPVLNVGTGHETSTQALAEQIASLTGGHSTLEHVPLRPGDIERSVLDTTRCREALGEPTGLSEGLAVTARWYRERS